LRLELFRALFRNRLQTPTLIGCMFLMILKNHRLITRLLVCFATISGASQYTPVFDVSSTFLKLKTPRSGAHFFKKQDPSHVRKRGLGLNNSLTMTYFHTGIRTIIGAKSFHCPVRDGKEWDQLAMVVRHNLLLGCDVHNQANS
jgi:hypothetical protein